MNISKKIEELKNTVKENPIKLYSEENPRRVIDPSESFVNTAFVKICEIWNGTEQSRNFIKHLIKSFLPKDDTKVTSIFEFSEEEVKEDSTRCCILGVKIAGVDDIVTKLTEYSSLKESIEQKAQKENRELSVSEQKYLDRKFKKLPIEVQNATRGLKSEYSRKYISLDALTALKKFVEMAQEANEPSIINLVKVIQEGDAKRPERKPHYRKTGFDISSMITEDTLEKLKGIK